MSKVQLTVEYQQYATERLLKLRARHPELAEQSRQATEEVLASRPECDPSIVEEWERRGDAYKRTTRPLKGIVQRVVVPLSAAAVLLLPVEIVSVRGGAGSTKTIAMHSATTINPTIGPL